MIYLLSFRHAIQVARINLRLITIRIDDKKRSPLTPLTHWPADKNGTTDNVTDYLIEGVLGYGEGKMHWAPTPVATRVIAYLQHNMALFTLQVGSLFVAPGNRQPKLIVIELNRLIQIFHVKKDLFNANYAHVVMPM